MQDLRELESHVPSSSEETPIHGGTTPLSPSEWEVALRNHLDQEFADYICTGIRHGFRIGFSRSKPLRSMASNIFSVTLHPKPIAEYLMNKLKLNRMLGSFNKDDKVFGSVHVNRFGIISKGYSTGKWRLITDLSYPSGSSVNDGIDPVIACYDTPQSKKWPRPPPT